MAKITAMKTDKDMTTMLLNNELKEKLTIQQQTKLQEILLTKDYSVITGKEVAPVCSDLPYKGSALINDHPPSTKIAPKQANIADGKMAKMMFDEEKCRTAEKHCEVTISNGEMRQDCILANFNLGKYRYLQDNHQEALLHWINAYNLLNSIDKDDEVEGTNGLTVCQFTEIIVSHIKLVT